MVRSVTPEGVEPTSAQPPPNLDRQAAQYIRMSTDYQVGSPVNQRDAIAQYASRHGLTIVRTYADEGRSGLSVDGREGLIALIQDVSSGRADYRTVLVYDVSRWGRFQNSDESAFYEFLCLKAGIRVEYCAEPFTNDGSAISMIVKNLKRIMAAEYSRELSVKITRAKRRLALLGFRQGGSAGYGLRRVVVDVSGNRRGILEVGQRKFLQTDRVVLALGPPEEGPAPFR